MIKKLKCCLSDESALRHMRDGIVSIVMTAAIVAVTLFGCPIKNNNFSSSFFTGGFGASGRFKSLAVSQQLPAQEKADSFKVYVTCCDETVSVDFSKGTVADALALAGVTPDGDDMVEPSLDTVITDTVYIDFIDVRYKTVVTSETIPHETTTVYSNSMEKGYSKTTQKGSDGEKEVVYLQKLVNGYPAGSSVAETRIIKKPVNETVTVGTMVRKKSEKTAVKTNGEVKCISTLSPSAEIKLDADGNPVNYKKKLTVTATAYTYTGKNCSTGVKPQPGYIAVNPRVIPYGTKLYIKSPDGSIVYGYAVAADTGGFIKRRPNGIDLFMTTKSACKNFGIRNMEVYIIE